MPETWDFLEDIANAIDNLAGEVKVLDGPTWQQRRQRLQELGGPPVE